ncbi:ribonuclease Z, mitochondrial [Caerostris extrusa]|uniref:ribonuclease Z n=1 Tax=Caerostris extrusa TaxID=172846 RepID=A0AAV4PYZ1_CAEEX|nr:ribonuclease Z, mitochondrial [Caerostris extrusa]
MSKVKPNKNSQKPTISINSKKCRYLPSEIYLCVLGNGSKSSPRSLYLFTDHSRYLFNCGEGTQRLAQEYKMKLSKLEHVFITHKSWENCGGLLGLSLTIQDAGLSKIILHGPPEMNSLYRHSETFVYLKNLEIVSNEDHGHFCDDNIEVQKIPISVETSSESVSERSSDSVKSSSSNESFYAGHKSKKLRTSTFDWTIAYACKFKNKQGQLLMEKCVEFGVPVGPLLGNLKDGKDVVLPSGKVILSKDVVSPEEVCPFFLR